MPGARKVAYLKEMSCNASLPYSCGENGACIYTNSSESASCFCQTGFSLDGDGVCSRPEPSLPYSAVASFCWLCFLLVLGKLLRLYVWIFQKLYLPASVIGGLIGLLVLQLARLDDEVAAFIARNFTQGW